MDNKKHWTCEGNVAHCLWKEGMLLLYRLFIASIKLFACKYI